MNEMLLCGGYPALFLLSFAASTLIPVGSEWLLVALILKGFSPAMTVAVATFGNYLIILPGQKKDVHPCSDFSALALKRRREVLHDVNLVPIARNWKLLSG